MLPSSRYLLALVVNVVLPIVAFRVAVHHVGLTGSLVVSMVPLLAWMLIDYLVLRHFDALSALAAAGVVMSVLVLISAPAQWVLITREPIVSGAIGVLFLLSLGLRKPLVYYLARSTMARERSGGDAAFDAMWRERPALVRSIRIMTAVWGIGQVSENAARLWVIYRLEGDQAQQLSTWIGYGAYAGLTIWTLLYRRFWVRKQTPDAARA
jgi:hypothetical protein